MKKNPKKRLGSNGIHEIMEHSFFKGVNWDDVAEKKLKPPFIPKVKGVNDMNYIYNSVTNGYSTDKSVEPQLTFVEK